MLFFYLMPPLICAILYNASSNIQVKGITGPNRGLIGTLINIDEGDGIVKLDADAALKIISLNQLAKYVPRQR